MMKEYILGKIFDELFALSKKKGTDFLKSSFKFNQFISELGISFPIEDTYSSIYIRALLIINDNPEYCQFIPLLKLKEVFESYIEFDKSGNREIFFREVNTQLHVNPSLLELKNFNSVPPLLIPEFIQTFNKCRIDSWSPKEAFLNTKLDSIENTLSNKLDILGKQISGIQSLQQDEIIIPERINKVIKGRIDQIFEDIKKGNIDSGLKALFSLKDEIWLDIDVELRNSLIKKIAFCHLEKNEFEKAILFYEEAKKIKTDSGTLSTLALLYFKENHQQKLDQILTELGNVDSKKEELTRIRFGTSKINHNVYYQQGIADELKDEEALLSLTQFYSENHEYKKAFEIGRKLVEHYNKIEYKEYTSEFGVQYLQMQGVHMSVDYLSEDDKDILNKGTLFIRDCAHFYQDAEIIKYKTYILNYHAIYEMWNDNYEEAIRIANQLLSIEPNNYQFIKTLGAIYTKKKDYPKVIEIYNNIPDDSGIDDLPLMKSICHFVLNDIESAKKVLIIGLNWITDAEIKERTIIQLINFCFFSNDFDEAERVYNEHINILNSQSRKIIQAKLYRHKNQTQEANSILFELKKELIESPKFSPLILEVGSELERLGEFDQTIELYEKFANYQKDTFFVGSLYDLYHRMGRINKVVEICESQRKNQVHEFYTRNEIAIYFNYREYDKVIELGKEYISCFPANIEIRLFLIHCLVKKGNKSKANEYLKYPFDIKILNLDNARKLLGHYLDFNLKEEAFETAYKLIAYNKNEEFYNLYITLSIQEDNFLSQISSKQLVANSTAIISENNSPKVITFIDRETEEYLQDFYSEVEINHIKYHKLFGLSSNDKVTIDYGNERFDIEIHEIKHRYLFAFHKLLKECNNFKSGSPIKVLDISDFKNGTLPELMQEHLDNSEKSQEAFETYLMQYKSGKIPLISVSIIFGHEFLDVWKLCTISNKHFIRVSSGDFKELESLNAYLQSKDKIELLFDLTSLLLLFKIGLVDALKPTFEIYILQDVLDYIEDYILQESIGSDQKSATLTRINGKTYFIEKSADEKRKEIVELEQFKNWIKANFKVYSPTALIEINHSELEKHIEALGNISGKSYLIAKAANVIFICDDHAIRQAFQNETRKPVIWTQALFNFLNTQNLIDLCIYNDVSLKLVEQNIKYTHITGEVIYRHFIQTNFLINNISHKLFNILRGKETDNSAFLVAFDVLKKIWENDEIELLKKRKITFEILLSLFINRKSIEAYSQIILLAKVKIVNDMHWYEIDNQLKKMEKFIAVIRILDPLSNKS